MQKQVMSLWKLKSRIMMDDSETNKFFDSNTFTGSNDSALPNLIEAVRAGSADSSSPDRAEHFLIELAKLDDRQVARAREVQERQGITFLEAALRIKAVQRDDLMAALSKRYSYPIIHADDDNSRFSQELVVGRQPFGAAAEAIRSIRTSLVSSAVASGTRSFVMIGPRRGAGCTFFASNLALAFAQMSLPTLLVDANLRDPRVAEMFGFGHDCKGLSECLRTQSLIEPSISYDVIPGLSVITSGSIAPNPQELLCSEEFVGLVAKFAGKFGIVIYDTPSAMDYADAHVVASRVGSAIIVARKNQTTFSDVSALAAKLRAIQCNIIGSTLNEG
jgi:protein-tyrosine kinase